MPILIDGWNLIRNSKSDIDDDDSDSLESARALVGYLGNFQRSHRDPITLVFDSSHEHLDFKYVNSPALKIVAAKNADEYIKRRIDDTPENQRRNLRVVSSDLEVYYFARDRYAIPLKCEEFWDTLRRRRHVQGRSNE